MPEGDTLARTAIGLRPYLLGRTVTAARARVPGPQVGRIVGAKIVDVLSVGKNLLIRFDDGLEIRTHLRMNGTWHRYRPGERWRRAPARAVLVLEVPGAVAVCFDAPVVELLETRTESLHPALAGLGPDLLDPAFDPAVARSRLRAAERASLSIAEALLDQRAMAGIGNAYKSEVLFIEGVDPFARVGDLDDGVLDRLIATARRLLQANVPTRTAADGGGVDGGPRRAAARGRERVTTGDPRTGAPRASGPLWVYGRGGRPCRRCGTLIRVARHGADLPRSTYWCPRCQRSEAASPPPAPGS